MLRSGWLTTGPKCQALEAALSKRFDGRPVRLVNSGTASLELALRLCDIGPGDEVITTPMSWVATANVVLAVGATPVFVDVDAATRNIDLDRIEAAITPRTRALLPVDLAGLPIDRDRLNRLAAASMACAWSRTRRSPSVPNGAGGRSAASATWCRFSFHANKNMTFGEGGCLVMNDEAEARRFELLRLQGVQRLPGGGMEVEAWGAKANMTDIAAAIGLGQLRSIDDFNLRRRQLARRYFERWDRSLGFELPPEDTELHGNWHMFQPLLPRAFAAGAPRLRRRHEGAGLRRRRALPRDAPVLDVQGHGPRPRRFPGRRGHRRTHGHAAVVPGHDGRRRRSRVCCRHHRDGGPPGGAAMTPLQSVPGHEADHDHDNDDDIDDDTPELSVVIPVYNEEEGLRGAVRSALPGAGCAGGLLRADLHQRRQPRPFGRSCWRRSSSGGRTSRA